MCCVWVQCHAASDNSDKICRAHFYSPGAAARHSRMRMGLKTGYAFLLTGQSSRRLPVTAKHKAEYGRAKSNAAWLTPSFLLRFLKVSLS
jgi:hypothetical protein